MQKILIVELMRLNQYTKTNDQLSFHSLYTA